MWLVFAAVLGAILTLAALRRPEPIALTTPTLGPPVRLASELRLGRVPAIADSVVALALRLRGTDYCYAGVTPETGFDCSGFITYCFSQYGITVPHGSDNQAVTGQSVPRAAAQPGDIIIFTGTEAGRRSPGHAGIVISRPGEGPLRFVHSSSARKEHGVKVSQVEDSGYEARFLQVRRVVGERAITPKEIVQTPTKEDLTKAEITKTVLQTPVVVHRRRTSGRTTKIISRTAKVTSQTTKVTSRKAKVTSRTAKTRSQTTKATKRPRPTAARPQKKQQTRHQ